MARLSSKRADDDRVLDLLQARRAGQSARDAGARFGMSAEAVRIATNRVRDADVAESGEPAAVVLAAYQGGM